MRRITRISILTMVVFEICAGHRLFAAPAAGDACSYLSPAEIASALGVSVDTGQHIGPGNALCEWSQPGDSEHTGKRALLTLYRRVGKLSPAERFENGKLPVEGIAKTPVSGIGDDAYYIDTPGLGAALNVKKGSAAFQIRVYNLSPDETRSVERVLAQGILAKL